MLKDPFVGQAAVSRAGHDKGKAFVVTAVLDGGFVLISDGDSRKQDKPKKKKCMHLFDFPRKGRNGMEALMRGEQVTDAAIRKYLLTLAAAVEQDS